ncbi:hypothetical protein Tco_0618825 [Tanacetum coccineum]
MKLNNEYESVRSQILAMDLLSTVNKAYYIVKQIEKQKQVTNHTFEPIAFFSNMNNKGTNGRRKNTRGIRNDALVNSGFDEHFSGDYPFDMGNENEIGLSQDNSFDKKLVATICQETMRMFKAKGVMLE